MMHDFYLQPGLTYDATGGGWASTHLEHDGLDHVMHDEHEVRVPDPVAHVLLPARKHVVDHDHLVTLKHDSRRSISGMVPPRLGLGGA